MTDIIMSFISGNLRPSPFLGFGTLKSHMLQFFYCPVSWPFEGAAVEQASTRHRAALGRANVMIV